MSDTQAAADRVGMCFYSFVSVGFIECGGAGNWGGFVTVAGPAANVTTGAPRQPALPVRLHVASKAIFSFIFNVHFKW